MTSLARLQRAVACKVASATAIKAYRPLGRLLFGLGGIATVSGLLVLFCTAVLATVATPAALTPSLAVRASTSAAPTAPVRDERMGWRRILLLTKKLLLRLDKVYNLLALENLLSAQLSKF